MSRAHRRWQSLMFPNTWNIRQRTKRDLGAFLPEFQQVKVCFPFSALPLSPSLCPLPAAALVGKFTLRTTRSPTLSWTCPSSSCLRMGCHEARNLGHSFTDFYLFFILKKICFLFLISLICFLKDFFTFIFQLDYQFFNVAVILILFSKNAYSEIISL